MKNVIKHLIFSKDTVSKDDVEMELLDATTKEISVCLLIANTLKMFLPARTKYHILAYQLHFCLFANDVLEYAGYSKFSRELCPKTSISNINTLHLDAPSIYQILTQKLDDDFDENQDALSTELIIYGYNKEPIPSIERARRNKDAIFNSIFDYTKIQESCEHSGLIFNQRVSIIPGLKTVRILGVKEHYVFCGAQETILHRKSFTKCQCYT